LRGLAQLGLLAICGLLLLGAASGCATTQDTAAKKQTESRRILRARDKRQKREFTSRFRPVGMERGIDE
jgi:hypothetical protein